MTQASTRRWLLPLVALGLGVSLAAGYWFFRDYFNPPQAVELQPDGCDLQQQACRRSLPGGGEMVFEIRPRPIPLVSPLKLRVEVKGIPVRRVEVDFAGLNMNMGYNRPRLREVAPGRFEGEGYLPVCIRERMEWEAKVLLHLPGRVLAVPYRFDTIRE